MTLGMRHGLNGAATALLIVASMLIVPMPASAASILLDNYEGAPYSSEGSTLFAEDPTPEATLASVNIRPATDAINNGGGDDFDNFFGLGAAGNHFLVLGDDVGNFGNEPNGTTSPVGQATISRAIYNLAPLLPGGTTFVQIGFDYAFDANDTVPDIFKVILGSETTGALCLQQSGTTPNNLATRQVGFSCVVPVQAVNELRFLLDEEPSSGSSAVGIDNLTINAVPEPATLALVLTGLVGVGLRRRGRKGA